MQTIDRYIELENGDFAVDLFPYKIKDVNNFYNREHPKELNPRTFLYKKYWGDRAKDYTEGRWINDGGTWFFLMPKLDFYLNYVIISDEDRNRRHPSFRDNEAIVFTYLLCAEGFSGFDGDDKYTCNKYVGKIVNNEKLQAYEQKILDEDPSVLKADGTYKEYVDPWVYLTETYLLTDNRDKPLGQALYNNGYYNVMILASRAVGKSFIIFLGLFLHEWLFGNVRRIADIGNVNNFTQFGMAAADSDALSKSIANLDAAYYEFPGQYNFQLNKKETIKQWGPFFKITRGNWKVGSGGGDVEHILKLKKGGKIQIKGSKCQIALIGGNKDRVFAGDRYRLILIEETGFVKNLKAIYSATKDSVTVGKKQVGQIVMAGTGGQMDLIGDSKEMFENPQTFNIFPIPNYWTKQQNKYCGLFLGKYLQAESFKENGNTNYKDALFDVVKDRELMRATYDSVSFAKEVSFNPIYPKELLRPTTKSVIPVQEMQDHLEEVISKGLWDSLAMIGSFGYKTNGDVEFRLDKEKTLVPITKWGRDKDIQDATGAWVLYEEPPEFIPEGLYYILYDPYTQSGGGTSLQSILVYKAKYKAKYSGYGEGKALQDTIVASYIGRIPDLDKSYEESIKAARFFNATVFPELNSIGFSEYVNRKNYNFLMQKTPISLLKTIKGSSWQSHIRSGLNFGVKVNEPMNIWSINRLANWLMEVIMVDDKGLPIKRNYQNILDLRLLSELVNFDFDNKPDFDSVSALMLLPYLLGGIDEAVEIPVTEEDDLYRKYEIKYNPPKLERPRAKINQY